MPSGVQADPFGICLLPPLPPRLPFDVPRTLPDVTQIDAALSMDAALSTEMTKTGNSGSETVHSIADAPAAASPTPPPPAAAAAPHGRSTIIASASMAAAAAAPASWHADGWLALACAACTLLVSACNAAATQQPIIDFAV